MNPPVTGREALLIEALGEMAEVLDRVDHLLPALGDGERRILDANSKLAALLGTIDARIVKLTDAAKLHLVKHIAEQGDKATLRSIDLHLQAMEKAAQKLFAQEVGPTLRSLVQPLQRLYAIVQENANPWNSWLTHAATAMGASLGTWFLTSGVLKL